MKEYFLRLIEYNQWANSRIYDFLESRNLKDDQILKLLSHIQNAEYVWLSRLTGKQELAREIWGVHNLSNIVEGSTQISALYKSFLNESSEESLKAILHYKTSTGVPFSTSVEDILTHVINHGSYHRGQVNRIIRQYNLDPPMIDFIIFSRPS